MNICCFPVFCRGGNKWLGRPTCVRVPKPHLSILFGQTGAHFTNSTPDIVFPMPEWDRNVRRLVSFRRSSRARLPNNRFQFLFVSFSTHLDKDYFAFLWKNAIHFFSFLTGVILSDCLFRYLLLSGSY